MVAGYNEDSWGKIQIISDDHQWFNYELKYCIIVFTNLKRWSISRWSWVIDLNSWRPNLSSLKYFPGILYSSVNFLKYEYISNLLKIFILKQRQLFQIMSFYYLRYFIGSKQNNVIRPVMGGKWTFSFRFHFCSLNIFCYHNILKLIYISFMSSMRQDRHNVPQILRW